MRQMFSRRLLPTRKIIKIIFIIIIFAIFLSNINRRSSSQIDITDRLSNNLSRELQKNLPIQTTTTNFHHSRELQKNLSIQTTQAHIHHTCDIAVEKNGVPLAHRFPQIIIIGFGKAGTRALYQMIRMHPDVVGPSHEVRFFSNDLKYGQGIHSYTRLMPVTTLTQKTIEKSPDYIIRTVAAKRLKKALNHCHRGDTIKFIVVLREPFDRTISEYLHWKLYLKSVGKTLKDFEKLAIKKSGVVNNFLAQVNTSIYSYHIKNWLKVFDKKQMCFVDGDRLIKDPYSVVKKLEKCLGLRDFIAPTHFFFDEMKGYYCPVDADGNVKCLGAAKGRKHPVIDNEVERKVRKFFEPYNKELYEITGIDFGWT